MQSNFFTRILIFPLLLGVVPILAQTPFFTEDFDDEAAALSDWGSGGENEGSVVWAWSDNPALFIDNFPSFGAPTADNGFMFFDSFANGFQNTDHVVTLTSPIIDCSGRTQVFLEMYTQYVFYFADRYIFDEANVEVGVSIDGGEFTYQGILVPEVDPTDRFNQVQRVVLALPDAINQSQVQIQIRWTGNREDFLNIDDIALYEADPILPNDLALDDIWRPSAYATPISQVDSVFFLGIAENKGADPQTNVRMRTTILRIEGENADLVFQDSSEATNMVMAGSLDTLALEEGFLPEEVGQYLGIQTVVSDETDDFDPNNQDIFEFLITNRTFTNDNGRINWPPLLPQEVNGDFWEGGNLYYVKNGEGYEVDSVQFSIFSVDDVHKGQDATILLYKIVEDGDQILSNNDLVNVGFSNYTFGNDDESFSLISAPIFREDGFTPGVPLEDSTEYIVMVSVPDDVWFMYTYRDIIYEIASVIRNGGELSRFDPRLAMMIRMTIRATEDLPVKEPELADSRINSFPNPAREFYRIDLDLENPSPVQLQLTSMSGQIIIQREYTSIQRDRIDLDVSELAAGAYLVKVRTEEGVKTLKLTKQ